MESLTLTSRADLLRQLKHHSESDDKCLAAGILGYELLEVSEDANQVSPKDVMESDFSVEDLPVGEDPVTKSGADTAAQVPNERFIALRSREQYADPASLQNGLPECLQGVEPLSDEDLKPLDRGEPLLHQPLVQQSRLLPFLRRSLVYPMGERLDVARLVRKVARLEVLHRIPRKAHISPAGRVYVLLDLNKRLLPFWEDAHQLCDLLARKLGRNGLDIRVLEDDSVGGRYSDWFDDERVVQDWVPLKSPAVVLVVSDLGGLARSVAPVRATWLSFMRQLVRKGIRPLVLTPCVTEVCADFRFHADLVAWGRGSRFKKQTICRVNPDFAGNVRRVLGLLSVAVHVEPVLLRAILGCLPAHEADSDVEAAVYFHEDMVWGHTAVALKPEKREEYRALFRGEEAVIQRQVLSLIRQQHIGQFPFVWAGTVINAQPLVKFSLAELPGADIEWAERLMQRFTRSFAGNTEHQGMVQFARRELQRLGTDDEGKALCQQYAGTLEGFAYRNSFRSGRKISAKYDAAIVQAAIRNIGELRSYGLVQYGESLYLKEDSGWSKDYPLRAGSRVASFDTPQDFLSFRLDGGNWQMFLVNSDEAICPLRDISEIEVDTGIERLFIRQVDKPSWAHGIKRKLLGLNTHLGFAGKEYLFHWSPGESNSDGEWEQDTQSEGVGFDGYGLYADLNFSGLTQRFRWVEPGTFTMGSPEDEPGRDNDEDQHTVTLTQGYWLADTTVTQALWESVMGENPSQFKDNPNHPVEKVSWDDCQQFITKLNKAVPGLQAKLPTEAQWEYACRAGTNTPFSFGGKDDLLLEKVNYSGKWDEHDANGSTKPVKSYPGNDWGLYEMHGNVLEWCQDVWQGNLGTAAVIDPEGQPASEVALRVLRGGSWGGLGRDCRSAIRGGFESDDRAFSIGVRLSLGHSELMPGAGSAESGANITSGQGADSAAPNSTVAEQVQIGAAMGAVRQNIEKLGN